MGVPKFYRWISERYPCLSEVIKEHQIPEFDNLYLDMNGIIHICSHPNDDDPHFRITQEKIFNDIFHYIDFLFKMIKPKKVFFMAIDGVAPRAKMNQQRGRRFRSAKEAQLLEEEAISRGETLPKEARFDSNCITPGTKFMADLQELLRYFVSFKISTDKLWQNVRVYLSGHATPGEGEHKIMDFIRSERSQPGYDPNTRHCLYGLDADLIMLGLCSHEPHFSLLREEVRFGKKNQQKRSVVPEQTTFHLLHLSLMREYLNFEFSSLKSKLSFPYDLEKIIDDWVMMGFLVGNDFIPHLPHLHIHQDALPELYKTYIEVLPTLNGYINECGLLNLERFEIYLKQLAKFDLEKFNENNADLKYFEGKLDPDNSWSGNREKKKQQFDFSFAALESETPIEEKPEKKRNPAVANLIELSNSDESDEEELIELEFRQHKRDYYMNKLNYEVVTPEVLKEQAHCYVTAIQWNLHYYYNGVSSWGWFYPYHYSPFISDVTNFKNANVEFDLGKPFLPFEQLLSVLPAASKQFLPESYQKLMIDENSPLKDYYPDDFQTDLNGKQQNWEAVVLIPFINENLLLNCSNQANVSLNQEERERNAHGPHLLYTYCDNSLGLYKSPNPEWFPDIINLHASCTEIDQNKFRIPKEQLQNGLLDRGNQVDIYFLGFPTFKYLKHSAELQNQEVKVFQAVSRGNNMMITIEKSEYEDLFTISHSIIGKSVYIGWPHLKEAFVVTVANETEQYFTNDQPGGKNVKIEKKDSDKNLWKSQASYIKDTYFNRFGVYTQEINTLIFVRHYIGSQYMCGKDGQVIVQQQWSNSVVPYAYQTIVKDIAVNSSVCTKYRTISDLFHPGTNVFMLAHPYYGCMGEVMETDFAATKGRLRVKLFTYLDISLKRIMDNENRYASFNYMPGHELASSLGISGYLTSRITGTIFVNINSRESMKPNRVNIGLNLKFNRKNEEVPGYTKKLEGGTWLYSDKAKKVLGEYLMKFPQLFEKLVSVLDKENLYTDDIFPEENGKEILQEITAWLKTQECTTAEHQSCGAEVLDEGVINAIENAVDKFHTDSANNKTSTVVMLIKPNLLYSCTLSTGSFIPDINADYQLYDRVINVEQKFIVPLGLKGTIVGINRTEHEIDSMYDIVFDKEFIGGFSYNCSSSRRYRMPPTALINISYGERSMQRSENLQSTVYLNKVQHTKNNFNKGRSSTSPQKMIHHNLNFRNRQDNFHADFNDNLSPSAMAQNFQTYNQPSAPFFSPAKQDDKSFSVKQKQKNFPFYNKNQQIFTNQSNMPSNANLEESVTGNSASGEFITPKVNSLHPTFYNSQSSTEKKGSFNFKNTWEELKKLMPPSTSAVNFQDISLRPEYGKQVSVEALFQNAQAIEKQSECKQKQPQQNINRQNIYFSSSYNPPVSHPASQQPNVNYCKELMNYTNYSMGGSPLYKYSVIGPLRMHQAEVILPDSRSFTSAPSSTIIEATEKAAEAALLFLKANENRNFPHTPHILLNQNDFGKIREPYLPNESGQADEYGQKQSFHYANRNPASKRNFSSGYHRNDGRFKSHPLHPPEYFARHLPSEKQISSMDYGKWKRMANTNSYEKPHLKEFSNTANVTELTQNIAKEQLRNLGLSENMPHQTVPFIPFQVAKQTSAKKWEKEHPTSSMTDKDESSNIQKNLSHPKNVNSLEVSDSNKTVTPIKTSNVESEKVCLASNSETTTQSTNVPATRRTPRKSRLAVNFQNISTSEKNSDK